MIKLYDKSGNNLIGNLDNCLECTVEEEINGNFELIMIYPIVDDLYTSLEKENIIVADANDTLKSQKFRIYNTRKLMSNRVRIYARHISFDLMHDFVENITFENQSCEYILNQIFRNSVFSKDFVGYSDIINAQNYKIDKINCLSAIAGTEGSIIDTFGNGAEILRDNKNFHVLSARGEDNGVSIEYKKNLTGLTVEEDTTDLTTCIYPYATQKINNVETVVTLTENYVNAPNINEFSHPYITKYDYSDKFEDGEEVTQEKLRILAENEFLTNKVHIPKCNYKIKFIPLSKTVGYENLKDEISLCDTVIIKDARYNIGTQAKVIKTVYNVLLRRYDSMELGEPKTTLGDIISSNTSSNNNSSNSNKDIIVDLDSFPNILPSIPVLKGELLGFQTISLSWEYENKLYYSYEVYASKEKNFTPNTFNLIFAGQASTFVHEVEPTETWYYKVCAKNTYNYRTGFSNEVEITSIRIDDFDKYFSSLAVKKLVTNMFSSDYIQAGTIKGNWLDIRNLTLTDGNGIRTVDIDSFGRASLNLTSLKILSEDVATSNWVQQQITPEKISTIVRSNPSYQEDLSNPDNLILNSDFQYDTKKWNIHGNAYIDCNPVWMEYAHRMVYFHINSEGLEECSNGIYQYFYTQIGLEYTVTFYSEADHMLPANVYIGIENVELISLNTEENCGYKRHLIRFIANKEKYAFTAYGGRNTKFYLGNVMVQRGGVVRDWKRSSKDSEILTKTVQSLTEYQQNSENFIFKVRTQGINNLVKNSSFEIDNGLITAKSSDVQNVLITKQANEIVCNDNFLYLQGDGLPGDVYVETNLHFLAEPGQTYTLSVDCRYASLGAFGGSSSYIYLGGNAYHIFANDNFNYDWHRIYTTWTCPNNVGGTAYIRFGFRCADYSWGCYNNLKVEKGDIATPWCAAENEINEGITSIDEEGITVSHNNGSSASFYYDGSVWRDKNDKEILRIKGQGLEYIDAQSGEWTGFIKSSNRNGDIYNNGITFSTSGLGDYLGFGCSKVIDSNSSWSTSHGLTFENNEINGRLSGMHLWNMSTNSSSTTHVHNHTNYIQESGSIYMNGQPIFFDSYGHAYPNWIGKTNNDRLGIFGDNNVCVGTRHGTTNWTSILVTEGSDNDTVHLYAPLDMHNWRINNAVMSYSLANAETRTYTEDTILKSYDCSTRYIYKDIQIKNNKLTLSIPNVYKGCEYTICSIAKKGRGDVWISEEFKNYFIIESENDIKVNIEIDIKDKVKAVMAIDGQCAKDIEEIILDNIEPVSCEITE